MDPIVQKVHKISLGKGEWSKCKWVNT